MDRVFWRGIIEAKYAVPPDRSASTLAAELVPYLDSPDADLREHLAYDILVHWIYGGVLSAVELRALTTRLAQNLVVRDREPAFLRSFSALVLTDIVGYDSHQPCLEEADVRDLLERALTYLDAERDMRGYVPEHGWISAAAHAADLIWVLAANRFLQAPDLERVMTTLGTVVTAPMDTVDLGDLHEMWARAAIAALHRDLLTLPFVVSWLETLAHPPGRPDWVEAYRSTGDTRARHNTKGFLCNLYLQLAFPGLGNLRFIDRPAMAPVLLPHVLVALNAITIWN